MITMYRQCLLQRDGSRQTSWIPEKFAILGNVIRLKDGDVWDDGWTVVEVGSDRKPWEKILDHRKLGYFGSLAG